MNKMEKNKTIGLVVVLVAITIIITVQTTLYLTTQEQIQTYIHTDISIEEAKTRIDANTCYSCGWVIDVRTAEEYLEGHINNSFNIDVNNPNFESNIQHFLNEHNSWSKTGTHIIYCKSGVRSITASEKLLEMGFTNVYNVLGGYDAWFDAGYPTVTEYGQYQFAHP